jgi:hypothetical protein
MLQDEPGLYDAMKPKINLKVVNLAVAGTDTNGLGTVSAPKPPSLRPLTGIAGDGLLPLFA